MGKRTTASAPSEAKPRAKASKSTTEVVMLANVMHSGVLFKQGERVTLPPDVFSHFVSNSFATAVDVTASDENQGADDQSQKAGDDAGNQDDDKSKAGNGDENKSTEGTGASETGGADVKTDDKSASA